MSGDEPTTQELRAVQVGKREAEKAAAEESGDSREERTHRRRSEKAGYLAEKLDEQAEALGE